MNPFIHVVLPAIVLLFCLWGIRSVRGNYQQRSLIATLLLLAATLTIGTPAVINVLDGFVGITSFTTVLLVHLLIVAGVVCLIDFTEALCVGDTAWRPRPRHAVAVMLTSSLTLLYLGWMPHDAAALDYQQATGRTTEITFLTLFYLWMLSAAVRATTLMAGRHRRLRAHSRPPGGAALLTAGCVCGCVFTTWRILYMTTLLVTGSASSASAEVVSQSLMAAAILLFVAGILSTPVTAVLRLLRGLWTLHRLERLWRDLTAQAPEVVLGHPPASPWTQIRAGRVGVQVRRRAVEIHDAMLVLASRTPDDLRRRARAAVAELPPAQAEALWLRAALALLRTASVESASAGPEPAPSPDVDLAQRTEIGNLVRIARAYRRPACPDLDLNLNLADW